MFRNYLQAQFTYRKKVMMDLHTILIGHAANNPPRVMRTPRILDHCDIVQDIVPRARKAGNVRLHEVRRCTTDAQGAIPRTAPSIVWKETKVDMINNSDAL